MVSSVLASIVSSLKLQEIYLYLLIRFMDHLQGIA